jgi:DNA replication and repair protein RecF
VSITSLGLKNFRCFKSAKLDFSESINFFYGRNGSGKTSILEAIYLCSTGRSFKTQNIKQCIKKNTEYFNIFSTSSDSSILEIKKNINSSIQLQINSTKSNSINLFRRMPSTQLDNKTFSLFSESPSYRRKIMDRALIAAKKDYSGNFFRYNKVLSQRNNELRNSHFPDLDTWDQLLVQAAADISMERNNFFDLLTNEFNSMSKLLDGADCYKIVKDIRSEIYSGWKEVQDFRSALFESRQRDLRTKTTNVGPHRSDIKFFFCDDDVKNRLSRGEQKLVAIVWCAAINKTITEHYNSSPILIIDDLGSELDEVFYNELLKFLSLSENQLFFSNISDVFNSKIVNSDLISQKFHVEQFSK